MQETSSYQPLQQQESSGKQLPVESSNEGFNIRQGGNQPENLGWSKQGYGSTGQQQWQQSGQQQRQGWQQSQGWQQEPLGTGVGSGGIRAIIKDSSGKHVQDSSIRVRVKGEQVSQQPIQQSFQKEMPQTQQPVSQGELPKVFRDLPPGEVLRPLEEIDERAIWATRSTAKRPPEAVFYTGDSPYQPFLQKPSHKPLKEATVQEQRQHWATAGGFAAPVQPPTLPSKLLAAPKPTRRVRYPPTSEQLLSQKGKLRYTGLLAAASVPVSEKPLSREEKYKGEMTRPGVDDTRRNALSPIREEGEMVQMDVSRVNNPEKSIRSAGMVSTQSNIVLADAPPHVEAVPLAEQHQQHASKEGFFGKIKHMFDKKEA
jgi:hypothetical protein